MRNLAKIVTVAFLMIIAIFVLKYASNFEKDELIGKMNLVINYSNVTSKMKCEIYKDEQGTIYLSEQDLENYYDQYLYYDKAYNRIITTHDDQIAYIAIDSGKTVVNGSKIINAKAVTKDGTIYIPISQLQEIYNIKVEYIKETDTVVIESLDRELKTGVASKKIPVKYVNTVISKNVDVLESGEKVTIIPCENNLEGWIKVRTQLGKIGYVQEKKLVDVTVERQEKLKTAKSSKDISIIWEYFSEYATAPERADTKLEGVNVVSPSFFFMKDGILTENVGETGESYIMWAHENKYDIWPMFANNTDSADKKQAFSKIMNDSNKREVLINSILEYVEKYNLDGINLDFENMYQDDKDMFSRFVIELAPRLKAMDVVFSVDVTAPDGSPDWSLCFDRNVIGNVADYVVFMAYDQNGISSKSAGTVAGYNWVELGIKKFIDQEGVPAEKLILGIPFYTRMWKESSTGLSSYVVSMKKVDNNIPEGVQKTWDEDCKQYYIEYLDSGITYKMWIEDEKSISEKLNLINQYGLSGAGFWVKGFESDTIWDVIDTKLDL